MVSNSSFAKVLTSLLPVLLIHVSLLERLVCFFNVWFLKLWYPARMKIDKFWNYFQNFEMIKTKYYNSFFKIINVQKKVSGVRFLYNLDFTWSVRLSLWMIRGIAHSVWKLLQRGLLEGSSRSWWPILGFAWLHTKLSTGLD